MVQSMQPRGKVLAVRGAVVDVSFQGAELPQLDEALVVDWDQPGPLLVEVQAHLDEQTVRGVALQATAGLQRGVPVFATGQPIIVPVGDAFPLAETLKGERVANHPAARRLQRFLTQPFAVTEAFTGKLLQMENHTNLMLKKRI